MSEFQRRPFSIPTGGGAAAGGAGGAGGSDGGRSRARPWEGEYLSDRERGANVAETERLVLNNAKAAYLTECAYNPDESCDKSDEIAIVCNSFPMVKPRDEKQNTLMMERKKVCYSKLQLHNIIKAHLQVLGSWPMWPFNREEMPEQTVAALLTMLLGYSTDVDQAMQLLRSSKSKVDLAKIRWLDMVRSGRDQREKRERARSGEFAQAQLEVEPERPRPAQRPRHVSPPLSVHPLGKRERQKH